MTVLKPLLFAALLFAAAPAASALDIEVTFEEFGSENDAAEQLLSVEQAMTSASLFTSAMETYYPVSVQYVYDVCQYCMHCVRRVPVYIYSNFFGSTYAVVDTSSAESGMMSHEAQEDSLTSSEFFNSREEAPVQELDSQMHHEQPQSAHGFMHSLVLTSLVVLFLVNVVYVLYALVSLCSSCSSNEEQVECEDVEASTVKPGKECSDLSAPLLSNEEYEEQMVTVMIPVNAVLVPLEHEAVITENPLQAKQ